MTEKASVPSAPVQLEHASMSGEVHVKFSAEKRLVRKQDFLITTLLSGHYLFAYLVSYPFLFIGLVI